MFSLAILKARFDQNALLSLRCVASLAPLALACWLQRTAGVEDGHRAEQLPQAGILSARGLLAAVTVRGEFWTDQL